MLKGADKAITALEAPKVKYTKDVYHLGRGEIVGDKFDFMGDSDIGVHVGTQTHAKAASKKYFVEKGDVMRHMKTFDIDNPSWEAYANLIEGTTNVPVARLHRKIQNVRAALDSENQWWQRLAVGLGWSKWDVGIENKEVEISDNQRYKQCGNAVTVNVVEAVARKIKKYFE